MEKQLNFILSLFLMMFVIVQCNEKKIDSASMENLVMSESSFGGFESQIIWGEHLVLTSGCNNCHTLKKMTAHGPVLDTALLLSGRPSKMPGIDVDRKFMESKGFVVTWDLAEWVGP
ncbi:hypothetical protein QWY93_17160 [Echinicola jeungdonensis]|uniref:Cytochrome c domain-containing protein n=1 Tax=Echinicola jeungdonensis TaxID=709343 RepID=A0ABV5J2K5_9BACT|nr:hypothetical protein [Echinicola jeungdonensis]MDN3671046.1 hypothetical protein [Echinicola jeungdonensis]